MIYLEKLNYFSKQSVFKITDIIAIKSGVNFSLLYIMTLNKSEFRSN